MELSWNVFLAINSMIDGNPVRGIRFNQVRKDQEESLIEETIREMIDTGISDENGKLTVIGQVLKKNIEQYKSSESVVFINRMRIGLVTGNRCPALIPLYEEGLLKTIDVRYVNKEIAFLELLEVYPILKAGHIESMIERSNTETIANLIMAHGEKEMIMYAKESKTINENYICLIDNGVMKKMDVYKKTITEVGGGDIRYQIAGMLGLTWV